MRSRPTAESPATFPTSSEGALMGPFHGGQQPRGLRPCGGSRSAGCFTLTRISTKPGAVHIAGTEDGGHIAWLTSLGSRQTHQAYFGYVVGNVEIIDCVQHSRSRWTLPGWWHWVLADPRALRRPFEFPGKQGWFEVPDCLLPARHLR